MQEENSPVYLAIDLGASGGRVLAGKLGEQGIALEEVRRFPNGPVNIGRRMVWNLLQLWEEVQFGLTEAAERYGDRVRSVGADTWGVDYVLLDRNDDQVGPCFCYRDPRTRGVLDKAFQRMSRSEMFADTGLQFMEINTAYQFLAMRLEESPLLDVADKFLMVPDFFHWLLSGQKCNEYTNASTTQLLNAERCSWSRKVLDAFEIPRHLFLDPMQPGASLGPITSDVQQRTGLSREVEVVLPATHDTGSAVLAVPASSFAQSHPDWCYISCGTWSLMGVEQARPELGEVCRTLNFTNEGGVNGSVRLLKNISGLWIVQQCREQWRREGRELSWNQLIEMARSASPMESIIDPDAALFMAPDNMPQAVQQFCRNTRQHVPEEPGAFVRCALESLALKYRVVLEMLEQLVGEPLSTIHMVGGGTRNHMLCQFAADACNRQVVAGPVEATAIGNILMQAIGTQALGSIDEARQLVRHADDIAIYDPSPTDHWDDGYDKLKELVMHPN